MKKLLLLLILCLAFNEWTQAQSYIPLDLQAKGVSLINITQHPLSVQFKKNNFRIGEVRSLIALYDSIYYWSWDTVANANIWKVTGKEISFVYDANYNKVSFINQHWNDTAWESISQIYYTYDANNNQLSELGKVWNGSTWVVSHQRVYTYDINNNETNDLYQTWNGTAWTNNSQLISTYDIQNNLTGRIFQTGASLANLYKFTYSYDNNNNLIGELDEHWNGSAWVNFSQYVCTYNSNNNLISYVFQMWNGAWENSNQYAFTYDANNNQTSQLVQIWNGTMWYDASIYTMTYDANNNPTSDLYQNWNGTIWVNVHKSSYAYDSNNNSTSDLYQNWNGLAFLNSDSTHYYFHTVTGINDLIVGDKSITISPNPFNYKTNITFAVGQENVSIKILDVLGKEIKSINFTGKQLLLGKEEMKPGIYIVEVIDKNMNVVNKKIIVQ